MVCCMPSVWENSRTFHSMGDFQEFASRIESCPLMHCSLTPPRCVQDSALRQMKNLLSALDDPRKAEAFRDTVCSFYECCMSYLEEWGAPLKETEVFSWTLLSTVPQWDEVESSFQFVTSRLRECNISETELFDETSSVWAFVTGRVDQWNAEGKAADERWVDMLGHFKNREIPHRNVRQLCEFAMCLPGTNAPVERIFSLMSNTWTDERNRMTVPTLKALLITCVNFDDTCAQFHS
ncbi:uncharacterized protein LOC132887760 [Neoarius graeffei]|uniref:uncharacterized protein LOC132887760 n=1 Tax=Neoarius graeffei TaxID=443677 RepID=UPI00298C4988|nr:uncharacterized protein LOC132887760 [Neoarius graeffei]